MPAQSPSSPSIKFILFVSNAKKNAETKVKIVFVNNRFPYIIARSFLFHKKKRDPAKTCIKSFNLAETPFISSSIPTKIKNKDTEIILRTIFSRGVIPVASRRIKVPQTLAKKASPPRVGIFSTWIFLWLSGIS
jgi:hypothetical protein